MLWPQSQSAETKTTSEATNSEPKCPLYRGIVAYYSPQGVRDNYLPFFTFRLAGFLPKQDSSGRFNNNTMLVGWDVLEEIAMTPGRDDEDMK